MQFPVLGRPSYYCDFEIYEFHIMSSIRYNLPVFQYYENLPITRVGNHLILCTKHTVSVCVVLSTE